ncbi:MAG: hypothetical protein AAFY57_04405, partial [Cyanobacteria bacterium J06642_2]
TFTDGTTATGQLQGVDNQGGSQALASEDSPETSVSLTVNGLSAGGLGSYNDVDKPIVVVNGPASSTARVVLTKGFIQPATNEFFNSPDPDDQAYAPVLQAQLDALAASDFPANNAVEFQTVDVVLTGDDQDISELFEFSDVAGFDFLGEDELPLGFVAGIIAPSHDNLPLGPVTQPIYLQFGEPEPELTLGVSPDGILENSGMATAAVTSNTDDTSADLTVSLLSTNMGEATVPETAIIPAEDSSATFTVAGVNDVEANGAPTPTTAISSSGFIDTSVAIDVADEEIAGTPVLKSWLYDADTDIEIAPIEEGDTLSVSMFNNQNLTIAATVPDTSPFFGQVESMSLDLNNGQKTQTDNVEPYSLFGNKGGNFLGSEVPQRNNIIEFDLYSENGLNGELLGTVPINLTLV